MNKQIKLLVEQCKKLRDDYNDLDIKYKELKSTTDNIYENLSKRQYLIDTNFIGRLTNKKLIEEFYLEPCYLELGSCDHFSINYIAGTIKDFKEEISNYDFSDINIFMSKLREFEKKQDILDDYTTGKKK